MQLIPLSKGLFAKIDDDDLALVNQHRWYENAGYAKAYYQGKRIRMHRLIMKAPDGIQIDHRDTDKLNNEKSNLRFCTVTQNNRNVKLHKRNPTGYKGVSVEASTGHFRPNVYKDGVALSFGDRKSTRLN